MTLPVTCCECRKPLDPADDDAHWAHESYCTGDDICTCDLYVCAGCCTGCVEDKPAVIPGQLELGETA